MNFTVIIIAGFCAILLVLFLLVRNFNDKDESKEP